ncbi:hypothetical protein EJ02DRAFT_118056 [Clathrospora elynae]|uniref:Uncharacterized protein n=1 Tax=Clathrospora elynae TaxID=706981 RepID=A0A6A5STC7_9PLEO|nr:hypothetical protein EJ02DRAFT_118056 [Clathrospora elynae]
MCSDRSVHGPFDIHKATSGWKSLEGWAYGTSRSGVLIVLGFSLCRGLTALSFLFRHRVHTIQAKTPSRYHWGRCIRGHFESGSPILESSILRGKYSLLVDATLF